MSLEISITDQPGGIKRIAIGGSLDTDTAPQLQQEVDSKITDTVNTTIIDFKELDYLSSAGLRVIFKAKKIMDNSGGKFLLVNLQPQIKKVFEIIKALDGMNVFKDQNEMDDYLTDMQNKVKDGDI
jgi:anti-anti-sigma factor